MQNQNQNKYKRYIILFFILGFFFIKNVSLAQNVSYQCSKDGYTVLTINGVWTNDTGAQMNKDKLAYYLGSPYNNQPIIVDYLPNPPHGGGTVDLSDAIAQGDFNEKSDYDLATMLMIASQKITTQKVLLVGHSQGNFYANNFYNKVTTQAYGIPKESIGVYAVATPANYIAGVTGTPDKTNYMNSSTDNVIYGLPGFAFQNKLPKTTTINEVQSFINPTAGHDFITVYLKYRADDIVHGIQASLFKLQTNNIQNVNERCMNGPILDSAYVNQGAIYAVLDHPIDSSMNTINQAINNVATGIYNTSIALGNGIINTTATVISALTSAPKLTQSTLPFIPGSNSISATAIVATDQNTNQNPQNNSQIPPKTAPNNFLPATETTEALPTYQNPAPVVAVIVAPTISAPVILTDFSNSSNTNTNLNTNKNVNVDIGSVLGNTGGKPFSPDDTPPASDTTPPVITILDANPISIDTGVIYSDAGATALDDVDGAVEVSSSGAVNISLAGVYTITYTATDHAGNTATATRTINVAVSSTPNSPTIITDNISTDTTWSLDGSPYVVESDVVVELGATLTIEPGVITKFNGTGIGIYGSINANGTSDSQITFTSYKNDIGGDTNQDEGASTPSSGDWSGVYINDTTGKSSFSYTNLSYAGYALTMDSNPAFLANNLNISDSDNGIEMRQGEATLSDISENDIHFDGLDIYENSGATINNFTSNNGGNIIYVFNTSSLTLTNANISNVSGTGILIFNTSTLNASNVTVDNASDDALAVFSDSTATFNNSSVTNSQNLYNGTVEVFNNSSLTSSGSTFDTGSYDGIDVQDGATLTLSHSTVENFLGSGVVDYGNSRTSSPDVISIDHSTITGNVMGINIQNTYAPFAEVNIANNYIYNNLYLGASTYSNIATLQLGNNWWGDETGPHNANSNPNGAGNSVSDFINFTPFCQNESCI